MSSSTDSLTKAREKAAAEAKARGEKRAEEIKAKKVTWDAAAATVPVEEDDDDDEDDDFDLVPVNNAQSTSSTNNTNSKESEDLFSLSKATKNEKNENKTNIVTKDNAKTKDNADADTPPPSGGYRLLNIAGEIINLEAIGAPHNSGRLNIRQFKNTFTSNESEIALLQKVFGIPTLRHTPKILTKDGCSLTENEGEIVRKILLARSRDLARGEKLSRGLSLASTQYKIRNYKALIVRLNELIGAPLEACEPEVVGKFSLPSMPSMPNFGKLFKKDDSVEKLLILILLLLLGVSSEKIRAQNIQQRLGHETIDKILRSIQTKSVKTANIEKMLHDVLDETTDLSTIQGSPLVTLPDKQLEASYKSLMEEFDELKANFNKATRERDELEAQLKGKNDAIKQLEAVLEGERAKSSGLQERANAAPTVDSKMLKEIESLQRDKATLTGEISRLQDDRVTLNKALLEAKAKMKILGDSSREILEKVKEKREEVRSAFAGKQKEIEGLIRTKEELLEQKKELEVTLRAKSQATDAVTAEKESLQDELRIKTGELAKEKAAREAAEASISSLQEKLVSLTDENSSDDSLTEISAATTPSTLSSANIAGLTSIRDRLEVLRKLGSEPDREKEIDALQDSLENMTESAEDAAADKQEDFAITLKNLLIQTALLDAENNEDDVHGSMTPEEVLEPVKEKLCLLLYFTDLFWNQIEGAESTPGYKDSATFIHTIDETFLPDLEGNDIWPTILQLGRIISVLEGGGSNIPEEAHQLIKKIAAVDADKKEKDRAKYRFILQQIRTRNKFLPHSEKYITVSAGSQGAIQIREKPKEEGGSQVRKEFSILESPYLFLLEMKLMSRYNEYILKQSPNRLECQSLGLQTE
jgi:hypothetical protein